MTDLDRSRSLGSPLGQVLLGRYRIVRELAKGGMGVVYLARSEGAVGFVKPVVVKLVLPEHATDQRFRNMFVREAQILASLRHPGIVDAIELGEENGAYVMVLEYVRGYHLGQWSKYLRLQQRQLPADLAIQIVVDVLDALHHAHSMAHPDGNSMHIVHRDVSPSNILLDEDGRARLLDFGVARMRGGNAEYMTQVKGFVGKLIYSAPEVFAEGGDATPASDAYACAVVLHEVLLGQNPFRAESQGQTLHRVLSHTPEAIEPLRPDAPRGLDAVLSKALSKAPENRFASARDFAHALNSLQTETESETRGKLAAMLKGDFGRQMSLMLGLESLADRDEAWRRLNYRAPDNDAQPLRDDELIISELGASNVSTDSLSLSNEGIDPRSLRHPPTPSAPPTASQSGPPTTATNPRRSPTSKSFRASAVPPPPPPSREATLPTMRMLVQPQPIDPRSILIVLGALSVGALGSYAWLGKAQQTRPAEVTVVRTDTFAAEADAAEALPEAEEPSRTDDADDTDELAAHAAGKTHLRARKSGRNASDPRALSAALSGQRARIEGCFKAHGTAVAGVATLSLAFALDAAGHVERATLSPPALADTELGQCLVRVAKATVFPAQGRALQFSIPLSMRTRAR